VGAGANEHDEAALAAIVECIDQQEIAADVAFAMTGPVTRQRMIQLLRRKRCFIGDQQQHRLF